MGSVVVQENDGKFVRVDWGRTKNLLGPENVGSRHLKINITEYSPGGEHVFHRHPDQEEVIYVLEGEGISRTNAGDQPIRPGSFVFITADTTHATINTRKDVPLKAIIIKSPPAETPERNRGGRE